MKIKPIFVSVAVASAMALSVDVFAAESMSATQQKQVEDVVHNYLVKNPEVLVESLQVLQKKQMDQARETIHKSEKSAPKFADELFHQTTDPVIGNANGKVSIVEFFDYQCPHCVEMTPVMEALIKSNPDLRVVYKEFPIRGPVSEFASKVALVAKNQGKYFEFHKALMEKAMQTQPLTEEAVLKVAESVGLNSDKVKTDIKADAIMQQIKANYKLGQNLQLMGTPALFIAKTVKPTAIVFIPGQVGETQLQDAIKKVSQ